MVESLACFHFQTVSLASKECTESAEVKHKYYVLFILKMNFNVFRRDELPGFPVFSRSLASSKPAQNGKVPYFLFINNIK